MLVAQNSLGPVCPVPFTVRGSVRDRLSTLSSATASRFAKYAATGGNASETRAALRRNPTCVLLDKSVREGKGKCRPGKGVFCNARHRCYGNSACRLCEPTAAVQWRKRDDVWISYLQRRGPLTVGYGALEGPTRPAKIGPELGFGWVVGDALEEPVLLIKCAWGGKSLAVDFRPPSAGRPPYSLGANRRVVGRYYREMIALTRAALARLRAHEGLLARALGSDGRLVLAGFAWHQGWNDRLNDKFTAEYEANLAHFIRDVRRELGGPALPFVIGETGMTGPTEKHPRALALMRAQAAVANQTEFMGNVAFVGTQAFWRTVEDSPNNHGHHWNSNAGTYPLIGEAMGEAMRRLLGPT